MEYNELRQKLDRIEYERRRLDAEETGAKKIYIERAYPEAVRRGRKGLIAEPVDLFYVSNGNGINAAVRIYPDGSLKHVGRSSDYGGSHSFEEKFEVADIPEKDYDRVIEALKRITETLVIP